MGDIVNHEPNADGVIEKPDPGDQPSISIILDNPATSHLVVQMKVPNIDTALNMLHQTIRVLEAERRKQELLDFQAEIVNKQMEQAVKAQLGKGPRIV